MLSTQIFLITVAILGPLCAGHPLEVPGQVQTYTKGVAATSTGHRSLSQRRPQEPEDFMLERIGQPCLEVCRPLFAAREDCLTAKDAAECACKSDVLNSLLDCTICGSEENQDWVAPSHGQSPKEQMAEILGGCKCQGHDVDKFDISKLKGPDDTAARLLEGDCGLQEGQGKKSHADMKETHQRLKGTSSPGEKEKEVEKLGDGTQPDGKANSLGLRLHCQGWIILVVPASMGTVYLSSMLAIL